LANVARSARTGDLGGEDDAIALPALRDPAANILLGPALRFRADGGDRIALGGVEEIDALIERIVDLVMGLGLAVLRAPGHRTEADQADVDLRAAKLAKLHVFSSRGTGEW